MGKKTKDIIIKIAAMIIAAVISTAFVVIGIGAIGLLLIGFNSICAFVGISSWAIVKIVFIAFLLLFIWCV